MLLRQSGMARECAAVCPQRVDGRIICFSLCIIWTDRREVNVKVLEEVFLVTANRIIGPSFRDR